MTGAIEAAARAIRGAYVGPPVLPVRFGLPEGDLVAAYAVQEVNTKHWLQAGRRLAGRKIGLTAAAVQRQLGVDQPDFGMIFADMVCGEGIPISLSRVLQPKIEAEVALVLERDLDVPDPTPADVLRATAYALPALEIVGSRIAGWDITGVDTIADNASSGLVVLGGPARRLDGLELRHCAMELRIGDAVASTGAGADCLGHPLNAAAWLAGRMARTAWPLRAGDIVMTGALGRMAPIAPGDLVSATIAGLGRVDATFTE